MIIVSGVASGGSGGPAVAGAPPALMLTSLPVEDAGHVIAWEGGRLTSTLLAISLP